MAKKDVDFDVKIQFLETILAEIDSSSYYYDVVSSIIGDVQSFKAVQDEEGEYIEFVLDLEEPKEPNKMN